MSKPKVGATIKHYHHGRGTVVEVDSEYVVIKFDWISKLGRTAHVVKFWNFVEKQFTPPVTLTDVFVKIKNDKLDQFPWSKTGVVCSFKSVEEAFKSEEHSIDLKRMAPTGKFFNKKMTPLIKRQIMGEDIFSKGSEKMSLELEDELKLAVEAFDAVNAKYISSGIENARGLREAKKAVNQAVANIESGSVEYIMTTAMNDGVRGDGYFGTPNILFVRLLGAIESVKSVEDCFKHADKLNKLFAERAKRLFLPDLKNLQKALQQYDSSAPTKVWTNFAKEIVASREKGSVQYPSKSRLDSAIAEAKKLESKRGRTSEEHGPKRKTPESGAIELNKQNA